VPNLVGIRQTVVEIWRFLDFEDGGCRHLGFLIFEILTVGLVKRVELRHCAKFRADRSNVAEIWRFFDFSKMAAVHHLRFVMRVWITYEGHLVKVKIGFLYSSTSIFKHGSRRHLEFLKFQFFNGQTPQKSRTASPRQISWLLVKPLLRYGGHRHLGFFSL